MEGLNMFFTKEGKPTVYTIGGAGITAGVVMKMLLDSGTNSKTNTGLLNFLNNISFNLFSRVSEKTGAKESNVVSITTGLIAGMIIYHYYDNQRKNIGNTGDSRSVDNTHVGGDINFGDKHTTTASERGIAVSGQGVVLNSGNTYGNQSSFFQDNVIHNNFLSEESETIYQLFELGYIYGYLNVQIQFLFFENPSQVMKKHFPSIRERLPQAITKYKDICNHLSVKDPSITEFNYDNDSISILEEHMELYVYSRYPEKKYFIELGVTCYDFEYLKNNTELKGIEEVQVRIKNCLRKFGCDEKNIETILVNIKSLSGHIDIRSSLLTAAKQAIVERASVSYRK